MRTRRVETLSAGEQTRLGLACMWAIRPDILLLDEPTCHLDIEGLELLTDFMLSHKGAALIVSHDRRFLDDVAMRLLELTPDGIRSFSGNYSAYRMQKEAEFDAQTKAYIHYKREERRLQGKVSQQMEVVSISSSQCRAERLSESQGQKGRTEGQSHSETPGAAAQGEGCPAQGQ